MSEQKDKAAEPAQPAAGGGAGKMIIIAVASSLVSVIAALAVFYIVVVPKLAPKPSGEEGEEGHEEEVAAEESGGGGGGHGGGGEAAPKLTVEFDDTTVHCVMASPDMPASILLYKVGLDCTNSNATGLIEENKSRFVAKIRELHSYKKRTELDNQQLEKDILKAVVQECNALLQEIMGKPSEKTRVKDAYHVKFFIQDM
ncbi:MAG: hypothetical protein FJY92_08410 [Candidatus Hydrogenedentes bacterium]|nr:hypothetical protein [Candidatus Hydrogenedentota bacterium]